MEIQTMHRGRLIDHVQLVVADLDASHRFYAAIFDALGIEFIDGGANFFYADEFVISSKDSPASQGKLTGRNHVAFQAEDRDQVERAYRAAIGAGGKDHGEPGERKEYHPGYYAGFLLDPDGNNVEIVHHGAAKRSAASVEISFEAPVS
jgi:catechol 2,3-dioxygenase-like lactoylglutathione lyase family enzyme